MIYLLIAVSTLLSCYIFERVHFNKQIVSLKESYQATFKLIKKGDKTELIIIESVRQFKFIFLLFLKLVFTVLPFLIVGTYLFIKHQNGYELIGDLYANIVIVSVAVVYILIKHYVFK